jgi:ABC-type Fe3+/spermidine/putrescine transport system ATPase subunit
VTRRSDGGLEFAGQALPVTAPSSQAARVVTIRPEAVQIETPCVKGIPATVAQVVYLGNFTRIVALPENAPSCPVTVELRSGPVALAPGAKVGLVFSPAALRVLA